MLGSRECTVAVGSRFGLNNIREPFASRGLNLVVWPCALSGELRFGSSQQQRLVVLISLKFNRQCPTHELLESGENYLDVDWRLSCLAWQSSELFFFV